MTSISITAVSGTTPWSLNAPAGLNYPVALNAATVMLGSATMEEA